MTTAQLAPTPVFRAFDNNGNPLAGGLLYTYIAGTSTPQASYPSSDESVPNTNPVVLNARGECALWLDPALSYKLQLTDALGNQIPAYPVDNIQGNTVIFNSLLTRIAVGTALYPQTAAEITGNVTPVNYYYEPGHVDRYFNNSSPGVTPATAGFQAAINQARSGGVDVVWGDTSNYLLDSPLDCTFGTSANQSGINFRQISHPSSDAPGMLLVKHNHYTVFDLTGCDHFTFYDLSMQTDATVYPQTCFLTARNSTGESNFPRFYNTTIAGSFSVAVLYNDCSEDGVYVGNYWANYATDAGACICIFTVNNYFNSVSGFMTSSFTTTYPVGGPRRSCIDHQFLGGQYALIYASSTSDVFHLEGAVAQLALYRVWIDNDNASGRGRSYFYNDTTNGPASYIHLHDVEVENGTNAPSYGIYFLGGGSLVTPSGWTLQDCYFTINTALIGAGTSVTLAAFTLIGVIEAASKGLILTGNIIEDSYIFTSTVITCSTSLRNFIVGNASNWTITTHTNDALFDVGSGSMLVAGGVTLGTTLNVPGGAVALINTLSAITSGAGSSAGTLTNAPAVGNPTKWVPIDDHGTTRYIPAW